MTRPLGAQLIGGGIGGWFESHLRASRSACVENPDTPELVLCGVTHWGPSELVLSLVPEADELAPKTPPQVTEALVTTCCLSVPHRQFQVHVRHLWQEVQVLQLLPRAPRPARGGW